MRHAAWMGFAVIGILSGCIDRGPEDGAGKAAWLDACGWSEAVGVFRAEERVSMQPGQSPLSVMEWRREAVFPVPLEASVGWRVQAVSGLEPDIPREREAVALLPRIRPASLEIVLAHRMTLEGISRRLAQLPGTAQVAAVVMDEGDLALLAPLGERLVSLVVAGGMRDLGALAAFPRLQALSLQAAAGMRLRAVHLGRLRHLELMGPEDWDVPLAALLDALGPRPETLRELVLSGEWSIEAMDAVARFPLLEALVIDSVQVEAAPDLDRMGPLCRLRELDIRAGRGLFPALWAWLKTHPRLEVLAARSLVHEPVRVGAVPAGLEALRLSGWMEERDVNAMAAAVHLRELRLENPEPHPAVRGVADGGAPSFLFSRQGPARPQFVELEELRRLKLEALDLEGNFRLPQAPLDSVRRLRWITGKNVGALDLSDWTHLEELEVVLLSGWALRLPRAGRLERLHLQDLSDPPLRVEAAAVSASLSPRMHALRLVVPGFVGDLSVPGTVRRVELAGGICTKRLLETIASWDPESLELHGCPLEKADLQAFFRAFPGTLRRLRLSGIQAAPGEDWTWEGLLRPEEPDFLGNANQRFR